MLHIIYTQYAIGFLRFEIAKHVGYTKECIEILYENE